MTDRALQLGVIDRPDLSEFCLKPIPCRVALGISFWPTSVKVRGAGWLHGIQVKRADAPKLPKGIEAGDILLAFAGTRVETTACLGIVLSSCEPRSDYEAIMFRLELVNLIPVGGRVFRASITTRETFGGPKTSQVPE